MISRRGGTGAVRPLRPPRHSHIPSWSSSAGEEGLDLCRMAGLTLDPEQEFVLMNMLGERPDGRWASMVVGICEPRQNGKGEILLARELIGLFLLNERLIMHSAHLFPTSLEAHRRLVERVESVPDFDRRVKRISNAHGKEGIELHGGQRILFHARSKAGGRGFTGNTIILDEAMDIGPTVEQALIPVLSAKSMHGNPQIVYAGSAVDQMIHDNGGPFARVRARGLAGDENLAWFEWAADLDNLDAAARVPLPGDYDALLDVEQWAKANPALGERISADFVRQTEFATIPRRGFALERLGIGDWPSDGDEDQDLTISAWDARADTASALAGRPWFTFDASPDRKKAAIAAGGRRPDRKTHVELVAHEDGTGWVVPRLKELKAKWKPAGFVCDEASPASSLIPELLEAGIKVRVMTAAEQAQAYGILVDGVRDDTIVHIGQEPMRQAVKGAKWRTLGDRRAWARRGQADITALVAVTEAAWAVAQARRSKAFSY